MSKNHGITKWHVIGALICIVSFIAIVWQIRAENKEGIHHPTVERVAAPTPETKP